MLFELYKDSVRSKLRELFEFKTESAVPKVDKIVLNSGIKAANSKEIDGVVELMTLVAGQKAVAIKAKKSVSTFKLREGMSIGCKVTLRGARMYSFLEHLIYFALPRTRDFRGLNPKSLDGRGNYAFGISDASVFPQVEYSTPAGQTGFDVCISTTAENDNQAKKLLELLGFPFIGRNS